MECRYILCNGCGTYQIPRGECPKCGSDMRAEPQRRVQGKVLRIVTAWPDMDAQELRARMREIHGIDLSYSEAGLYLSRLEKSHALVSERRLCRETGHMRKHYRRAPE